ncbi:MFS transporter [Mucilaginibacter rubeus]|uniref:MFS transporter n=1 Tax=Mucilaginibacter rubeus TaxID=2027860 RepID=UPI00166D8CFB|nr:MFS transporter [Mucilaginibacter rubeus]
MAVFAEHLLAYCFYSRQHIHRSLIKYLYNIRYACFTGITVSLIVVGKRAYFVDIYSGERLKNYTSMFSIISATAPVVAPFIGGYLQKSFGWQSNFYLLAGIAAVFLILELLYGGESLKTYHPFNARSIGNVYKTMLGSPDFSLGLIIIGISY